MSKVKELMAIRYLKRNPLSNSNYSKKMKRFLCKSTRTAQDILRQIGELNERKRKDPVHEIRVCTDVPR